MELIQYETYREYKETLDRELEKTAEGFVRIGYLLRLAEETNILSESGYKNVNEFAKAEYNLDPSQVSRFININKRFAEDGSAKLREHYQGFGYAKLALMLTLPENVNEIISPSFSKSEILELKTEIDKEKKITDLEVLTEGEAEGQQDAGILYKALHQLGHEKPELYRRLHVTMQRRKDEKGIRDVLAPTGESVETLRIQGTGRIMIAFKESETAIVNVRSNARENFSWSQVTETLEELMRLDVSSKESWESMYSEEFPENAPVQEKAATKKAPKPSKMDVPKKEAPSKESPKKETVKAAPKEKLEKKPSEPEAHQMQIEEFEEVLPEGYVKSHEGIEIKENPEKRLWNEIEDVLAKLQDEAAGGKDIEYMLQGTELMLMTLKEIKAVREDEQHG